MPNNSNGVGTFSLEQQGSFHVEEQYVIPESRLKHIESLLKRALKYEQSEEPWWKRPTTIHNLGIAFIGFAFFNSVSLLVGWQSSSNLMMSWIIIFSFLIIGVSFFLVTSWHESSKEEKHESYIEEIVNIIERTKEEKRGKSEDLT